MKQLGYFLKNLDQTNINSAFVSGMKEDLGMYGEELVTAVSIWTVGYVLGALSLLSVLCQESFQLTKPGQIPSNLLLTRVSPRWVIPAVRASLFAHSSTRLRPNVKGQRGATRDSRCIMDGRAEEQLMADTQTARTRLGHRYPRVIRRQGRQIALCTALPRRLVRVGLFALPSCPRMTGIAGSPIRAHKICRAIAADS